MLKVAYVFEVLKAHGYFAVSIDSLGRVWAQCAASHRNDDDTFTTIQSSDLVPTGSIAEFQEWLGY